MATKLTRINVTPRSEVQKLQWEMYAKKYNKSVSRFLADCADWFIYLHQLDGLELRKEIERIGDQILLGDIFK